MKKLKLVEFQLKHYTLVNKNSYIYPLDVRFSQDDASNERERKNKNKKKRKLTKNVAKWLILITRTILGQLDYRWK